MPVSYSFIHEDLHQVDDLLHPHIDQNLLQEAQKEENKSRIRVPA